MSDFESGAFNRALPPLRVSSGRDSFSLPATAIRGNELSAVSETDIEGAVWTQGLRAHVEELAAAQGFALSGFCSSTPHAVTASRFETWIDEGRAGEMEYLKRRDSKGTLLRSSLTVAIPWARSVIICAFNYNADAPRSIDPAPTDTGWIARYAWNGREEGGRIVPVDYHDDLLRRLRVIEAGLQAASPCTARCYVDTGPILERDFAARAGLGWTGKNTCLLNQKLGSWLLLGVIVTSLDLPEEDAPLAAPDRCGSCTRCIDACPTDALIAPRQMDASLCISYLTIEKKGDIAEELRAPMNRQVFGCDICQDVCPWNRKAPIARVGNIEGLDSLATRSELVNPPLAWLAGLTPKTFKQHFKGSPLERTKLKRLHRNTAIAMGNSGDSGFVPQLEVWRAGEDPVLAEAAAWAIHQLQSQAAAC